MLARTTMAPVGHCEYAAGGPAAREHWGPLDIHHVAKRSQRGTEEPSNLLRLCRRHHDMIPHPVRWPGEGSAGTAYIHAECEDEECRRAHAALSDKQRAGFLRWL